MQTTTDIRRRYLFQNGGYNQHTGAMMYTQEQSVNVNLYLRRRGLTCRECDTNHWLLRMVSPAPDIDPFDSEPTAIRIAVQCGYCGTERTTIVPLSVCYPQYKL